MFEHRRAPLLSRVQFLRRLGKSAGVGAALVLGSLCLGTWGYHLFAGLAWIDAFLNASMILTGMGPIDPMTSAAAKVFASFYALFSGIAFLTIVGVVFAPVVHRFLHRFHLASEGEDEEPPGGTLPSGR